MQIWKVWCLPRSLFETRRQGWSPEYILRFWSLESGIKRSLSCRLALISFRIWKVTKVQEGKSLTYLAKQALRKNVFWFQVLCSSGFHMMSFPRHLCNPTLKAWVTPNLGLPSVGWRILWQGMLLFTFLQFSLLRNDKKGGKGYRMQKCSKEKNKHPYNCPLLTYSRWKPNASCSIAMGYQIWARTWFCTWTSESRHWYTELPVHFPGSSSW